MLRHWWHTLWLICNWILKSSLKNSRCNYLMCAIGDCKHSSAEWVLDTFLNSKKIINKKDFNSIPLGISYFDWKFISYFVPFNRSKGLISFYLIIVLAIKPSFEFYSSFTKQIIHFQTKNLRLLFVMQKPVPAK